MVLCKRLIYLFGVLRRFQHCTGHITTGSWKGRGNQYILFARVLYCKLPTNGKQLPAFPLKAMTGIEPWPQRWEACKWLIVFNRSVTAIWIEGNICTLLFIYNNIILFVVILVELMDDNKKFYLPRVTVNFLT